MQLFLPDHMGENSDHDPLFVNIPIADPADLHSNLFPSDDDFEG